MVLHPGLQLVDVRLALLLMRLHLGVERLLGVDDEAVRLLAADARRLLDLQHLLRDGGHLGRFEALRIATRCQQSQAGSLEQEWHEDSYEYSEGQTSGLGLATTDGAESRRACYNLATAIAVRFSSRLTAQVEVFSIHVLEKCLA